MAVENVNSIAAAATYQAISTPAAAPVKEAVSVDAKQIEEMDSVVKEPVAIKKVEDSEKGNGAQYEQEKQPSESTLKEALKEMNRKIGNNTIAEFGIHEGTNRITIKLKDKETNEVIREVPAEKTLDLIQKAWELAGILVDERR